LRELYFFRSGFVEFQILGPEYLMEYLIMFKLGLIGLS